MRTAICFVVYIRGDVVDIWRKLTRLSGGFRKLLRSVRLEVGMCQCALSLLNAGPILCKHLKFTHPLVYYYYFISIDC